MKKQKIVIKKAVLILNPLINLQNILKILTNKSLKKLNKFNKNNIGKLFLFLIPENLN